MKHVRPLIFLLLFLLYPLGAHALPRFSLLTGRTCGSCHFNPTGSQLRSNGGTAYAQEDLSFKPWRSGDSDFTGEVSKGILLGGEMRMQFLETHDNVSGRTFQEMQADLYAGVTLHERLKLYGKIDFANLDYEAFGLAALVPKMLFLKFGAFLPDYGVRMDDHTIYTRGGNATVFGLPRFGLIFPYNYKDAGAEILFTHENLINAQAGVFNGGRVYPRFDSSFALLGRLEVTPSIGDLHFSIGGSVYHHPLPAVEGSGTRSMFGGFLGAGYEFITLNGEFDLAKNLPGTQAGKKAQAYFAELNVLLIDGLDLLGRYEGFDPDTGADNDQLTRIVLGAQFFPWSFMELRPEYRINKQKRLSGGEPTTVTNNELVVQLHAWF